MPPAFALSQDQTLRFIMLPLAKTRENKTNKDPTQSARSSSRQIQPAQNSIVNAKHFYEYVDNTTKSELNQSSRSDNQSSPINKTQTSINQSAPTKPKLTPQPSLNHQPTPKAPPTYPFHSRYKCQRAVTGNFAFTSPRRLSREPHPVGGGGF